LHPGWLIVQNSAFGGTGFYPEKPPCEKREIFASGREISPFRRVEERPERAAGGRGSQIVRQSGGGKNVSSVEKG